MQIWKSPSFRQAYARRPPSGEKAGSSLQFPVRVSFLTLAPSRSIR